MNRNRSQSKYAPSHENPEEQMVKEMGDKMIESYDHDQLRCHYHPQKQITNFCEENSCNLPMCPSCVSIHSEFHKQNKHQGMFKTLDVIIGRIMYELEEQFKMVRGNKDVIRQYEESIEMGPETLRSQLNDLKIQAIQAVEDVFEQLKHKLEETLDDQLHTNDNQLNMVQVQLDQYNQTLLEIEEDMKQDPLPTVVKIKGEKTLERLKNQMPQPQPIVNQLTQNMIQITPDGLSLQQNIQAHLNSILQLKTNKETGKNANGNQLPIASGYLGQQSATKNFQNGSPSRFQGGGQTIQRGHTPQKMNIDQQMYQQQSRQVNQLSSK